MSDDAQREQMISDLHYDLRKSLERSIYSAMESIAVARHERRALLSEANDLAHIASTDSEVADRLLAQAADALHAAAALIHRAHRPGMRGIDRGMSDAWPAAEVKVKVIEPISAAPTYGGIYLHLYETCPAVKRALARDGEVMRTWMTFGEISSSITPLCGVCRRWLNAR